MVNKMSKDSSLDLVATMEYVILPACLCGEPITLHPTVTCDEYQPSRPFNDPTDLDWWKEHFSTRQEASKTLAGAIAAPKE